MFCFWACRSWRDHAYCRTLVHWVSIFSVMSSSGSRDPPTSEQGGMFGGRRFATASVEDVLIWQTTFQRCLTLTVLLLCLAFMSYNKDVSFSLSYSCVLPSCRTTKMSYSHCLTLVSCLHVVQQRCLTLTVLLLCLPFSSYNKDVSLSLSYSYTDLHSCLTLVSHSHCLALVSCLHVVQQRCLTRTVLLLCLTFLSYNKDVSLSLSYSCLIAYCQTCVSRMEFSIQSCMQRSLESSDVSSSAGSVRPFSAWVHGQMTRVVFSLTRLGLSETAVAPHRLAPMN